MYKKVISGILIFSVIFLSVGCSQKQKSFNDMRNKTTDSSKRTVAPPSERFIPTEASEMMLETLPLIPEPPTLSESFTNPVLQSALETYFDTDFSQITQEDLDMIQFLHLNRDSIVISTNPFPVGEDIFPWEDRDRDNTLYSLQGSVDYTLLTWILDDLLDEYTLEIPLEESFKDASGLDFFTELKTLVIGNTSLGPEDINSLPNLQRLIVNYWSEDEDLSVLAKFPELVELTLGGSYLTSADSLSNLPNLQHLALYRTGISNLGLIPDMKNITSLTLFDNESLSDIQALSSMTWLKELYIEDVSYTDLNAIAGLTDLERLTITRTEVKLVNFLPTLTNLKYLRLDQNKNLKEIPPLIDCTQLEELYLNCTYIEDVSVLDGLSTITKATLLSPNSLSFLPSYTSLKSLELKIGWQIKDISPLSNLIDLEYLKLYGNTYYPLEGLPSLSNMTGLKELDVSSFDNFVYFDFIYDLIGLERLNLSNNSIFGDFSRIRNLTNLQVLYMDQVSIYSSFTMSGVPGARGYSYPDAQSLDQEAMALADLTELQLISMGNNELSDLNFVTDMTQLLVFNATDNYITDVSPLAELSQLEYVDLSLNAIENFQELDNLINTYIIR